MMPIRLETVFSMQNMLMAVFRIGVKVLLPNTTTAPAALSGQ
jgi:hypothetical protein